MTAQEQLLDAIGSIEEELLLKPKPVTVRRGHIGLVAAVLTLVLACGAFAAERLYGKTHMENTGMWVRFREILDNKFNNNKSN